MKKQYLLLSLGVFTYSFGFDPLQKPEPKETLEIPNLPNIPKIEGKSLIELVKSGYDINKLPKKLQDQANLIKEILSNVYNNQERSFLLKLAFNPELKEKVLNAIKVKFGAHRKEQTDPDLHEFYALGGRDWIRKAYDRASRNAQLHLKRLLDPFHGPGPTTHYLEPQPKPTTHDLNAPVTHILVPRPEPTTHTLD